MFMMRRLLRVGLVAAAISGLGACAQAPYTGRSQLILVSDDQLKQAGAQAYQQALEKEGVSKDAALQERVRTIGARIVKAANVGNEKWEFAVINDDTPNAFALPGGHVAVNAGLFKVVENDDQLAAVMGHEIGHVMAHHAAERVSQQMLQAQGLKVLEVASGSPMLAQAAGAAATVALTLPYSRTQEAEADEIGLMNMARAGYDPRQAITLWQNMERASKGSTMEFLSTHPAADTRIANLEALMPKAMQYYRAAGAAKG